MFRILHFKNHSLPCKGHFSSHLRYNPIPLLNTQFRHTFCTSRNDIGQNSHTSRPKLSEKSEQVVYPLDTLREDISIVLNSISGIGRSLIVNALESTNSMDRGDLILPLPKIKVADPVAIAKRWATELSPYGSLGKVCAKGPFLQFSFDEKYLLQSTVPSILLQKEKYGQVKSRQQKKVVVEFSSAKYCKPFHAGHLRSP